MSSLAQGKEKINTKLIKEYEIIIKIEQLCSLIRNPRITAEYIELAQKSQYERKLYSQDLP